MRLAGIHVSRRARVPDPRRRERGAAALELALLLPLLVLLLLGMFDYGKYFYVKVTATDAVREGVRKLSQTPVVNCAQATQVNAAIANAQGATGPAKVYMNQIYLATQTTVTATCKTTPVNPTWQLELQIDYQPTIGYMTSRNLMPKGTGTTARVKAKLAMRGR